MCDFEEQVHTPEEKKNPLNSEDKTSNRSYSNASKSSNILKAKTCSYFYNYGYCKFGKNCRYKHLRKRNENSKKAADNKYTRISRNINKTVKEECNSKLEITGAETSIKQENEGEYSIENESGLQQSVSSCTDSLSNLDLSSSKSKIYSNSHRPSKVHKKPICYYFKRGMCYKGDSCNFYHHKRSNIASLHSNTSNVNISVENVPDIIIENENSSSSFLQKSEERNLTPQRPSYNRHLVINRDLHVHDLSSLTESSVAQLRCTEINQLKKRFPHLETVVENQTYSILFEPSDPDWAFDVKFLNLKVNFPEKYPIEKCEIKVDQKAENFPLLLVKFLNNAISEWVDKKFEESKSSNKIELVFRPFLKWFDKNIEDLFISGLKKVKQDLKAKEDGIEFVPAENLFPASKESHSEDLVAENDSKQDNSELQMQISVPPIKISEPLKKDSYQPQYYGGNNGMKIIFSGLELTEGAAALLCTKISVTLQCARCKTAFNMKSAPKKNNSHLCSKCSKNVGFTFEPCTAHQFSSVLGTLHLLDCVAVDVNLVECHFLVDCLNCSKQVAVDGIHYGQKHKMWCTFCNEKMLISVECVRFQALKLAAVPDARYVPAKKSEKKVKDPIIKEGDHLPNFGACKHYKKSFRWLRFPCCGRLYPCDVCHDEKEIDHEMKFASRMICGFCSKEQPYSRDKPCIACSQSVTKKASSHWEGGKGCRNKIQMSREDKHKYAGVSKTVSKKAQTVKQGKK